MTGCTEYTYLGETDEFYYVLKDLLESKLVINGMGYTVQVNQSTCSELRNYFYKCICWVAVLVWLIIKILRQNHIKL